MMKYVLALVAAVAALVVGAEAHADANRWLIETPDAHPILGGAEGIVWEGVEQTVPSRIVDFSVQGYSDDASVACLSVCTFDAQDPFSATLCGGSTCTPSGPGSWDVTLPAPAGLAGLPDHTLFYVHLSAAPSSVHVRSGRIKGTEVALTSTPTSNCAIGAPIAAWPGYGTIEWDGAWAMEGDSAPNSTRFYVHAWDNDPGGFAFGCARVVHLDYDHTATAGPWSCTSNVGGQELALGNPSILRRTNEAYIQTWEGTSTVWVSVAERQVSGLYGHSDPYRADQLGNVRDPDGALNTVVRHELPTQYAFADPEPSPWEPIAVNPRYLEEMPVGGEDYAGVMVQAWDTDISGAVWARLCFGDVATAYTNCGDWSESGWGFGGGYKGLFLYWPPFRTSFDEWSQLWIETYTNSTAAFATTVRFFPSASGTPAW